MSKFLKFVTSWRFAEVVGGMILLVVGLFLLGRQFGLRAPRPPLAGPAEQAESTFAFEPGEAAYMSRQPTSRPARTKTRRVALPADRPAPRRTPRATPADEVPF